MWLGSKLLLQPMWFFLFWCCIHFRAILGLNISMNFSEMAKRYFLTALKIVEDCLSLDAQKKLEDSSRWSTSTGVKLSIMRRGQSIRLGMCAGNTQFRNYLATWIVWHGNVPGSDHVIWRWDFLRAWRGKDSNPNEELCLFTVMILGCQGLRSLRA